MISNAAMINCKLQDVARLRGFNNARRLADAMSEYFKKRLSYSTIYPLWDNTAENYSRTTLNRLCQFLNVSPGMLFEFTPDEAIVQPGASDDIGKGKRKG